MAGALIRKYDEVSRAANQALNDLERSLEDNKAWLEEYEQEIENNTITLADGTAVYYNAETGLFEEQQEDGTWRAVDQEAQKEALALVEENGGIAASRQAREFADELNEKHERLDLSIETMRLDITDIDKAVETGALSPDEGAALKEDVLARTEITQAEIDEAVLYREGDRRQRLRSSRQKIFCSRKRLRPLCPEIRPAPFLILTINRFCAVLLKRRH